MTTSFCFRAQAFSRNDSQIAVDDEALTMIRPHQPPERYPLSAIQAGNLILSDNAGAVGRTWYLKLAVDGRRKPLWINSTNPGAADGGAAGFLSFVAALKAALAAGGRADVIVPGSPDLAWLGLGFAGFIGLLALGTVALMALAVVQGRTADAVPPGLFLLVLVFALITGVRMWRANSKA